MSLRHDRVSLGVLLALAAPFALLFATRDVNAAADPKAAESVETCAMPYGTIAINEPHEQSLYWLRSYQLGSPSSLLRTLAQRSNCFVVVERGVGMQNMKQERELMSSGELQEGQNVGKGQIVAADFMMTPSIQGSDNNAGGVGGIVGGLGRKAGALLGGGVKFKEAQTTITVSSTRTSVQIAAAEGKARKRDFGVGAIFGGGGLLGGAGAYSSTAEGKVIAASLLDNFNAVVVSMKSNRNIKPMTEARLAKLTGADPEAGGAFEKGSYVTPKINGAKLLTSANQTSASISTLRAGEALLYLGERQDGFLRVQRGDAKGWVEQDLLIQAEKNSVSNTESAAAVMNEGDVMFSKINGVKVLRTPSDAAGVVATLTRWEEVVFLGEEKGTFIKIQASGGEGWVKRTLVTATKP